MPQVSPVALTPGDSAPRMVVADGESRELRRRSSRAGIAVDRPRPNLIEQLSSGVFVEHCFLHARQTERSRTTEPMSSRRIDRMPGTIDSSATTIIAAAATA